MYLLFPGRHHLLTQFQFEYLQSILSRPLKEITDINGDAIDSDDQIKAVIFAVTSANHSNTRRNPLPFYMRALALEEFGDTLPVPFYIYGVDDVGNVPSFSDYTVKRIKHKSEGMFDLTPNNTLVLCSSHVLEMYEHNGFRILPAELADRTSWKYQTMMPWDIVERIASTEDWESDPVIEKEMHQSSKELWSKYQIGKKVQLLFNDHMISDDGDITSTRDYNTYVRQMDEIAFLKFQDTVTLIRPGRIGDIGCAVGSWIKLACLDARFRESDFYGIEVARQLFDICQQRKHNGEFKNPFVFFSQRNAVTGLVFDKNSMDTIHTSSLTHEIESYGSRQDLLAFIRNRYDEVRSGGVWINRDVVGPEHKEQFVWMMLNETDGRNEDYNSTFSTREQLADYLRGLSTAARFQRFASDFRKKEGYQLSFEEKTKEGKKYVALTLSDACEFMSRKDYVDNWESEMHETFCFWDFTEWKQQLEKVGFTVSAHSKAYVNEWIVTNRLAGKVSLHDPITQSPLPFPVTNMIVEAIKN
jgi:hypothetical protein